LPAGLEASVSGLTTSLWLRFLDHSLVAKTSGQDRAGPRFLSGIRSVGEVLAHDLGQLFHVGLVDHVGVAARRDPDFEAALAA